mmetsp:Transcript_23294/g.64044  ORF Transcript_23294/g.64044 Transcript_23294/m.64044 type:complete len:204 (-) Transcript_23294:70-681(-)
MRPVSGHCPCTTLVESTRRPRRPAPYCLTLPGQHSLIGASCLLPPFFQPLHLSSSLPLSLYCFSLSKPTTSYLFSPSPSSLSRLLLALPVSPRCLPPCLSLSLCLPRSGPLLPVSLPSASPRWLSRSVSLALPPSLSRSLGSASLCLSRSLARFLSPSLQSENLLLEQGSRGSRAPPPTVAQTRRLKDYRVVCVRRLGKGTPA